MEGSAAPPGGHRSDSPIRRVDHDWSSDDLGTTIFMALDSLPEFDAAASQDVLFEHVDPDALGSLFEPTQGTERTAGEVRFPVGDYEVTVRAAGTVEVHATAAEQGK
jgi:hypothetical protein